MTRAGERSQSIETEPEVGLTCGGYRLVARASPGVFGARFDALYETTGTPYALEFVRVDRLPDSAIELFAGEVRKLEAFDEAWFVRIFGCFRHDAWLVLVTERLTGGPLFAEASVPMPVEAVGTLVHCIASALAVAHREGFVHGDLRDVNIWSLRSEGAPAFKLMALRGAPIPPHMSLEGRPFWPRAPRLAGEDDAAADVYALACIAHKYLAGKIDNAPPASDPFWHKLFPIPAWARALDARPRARPSSLELARAFERYAPEPAARAAGAEPRATPPLPLRVDQDVQISVYRPKAIAPDRWYRLLAYTHLAEKRPDDPADSPEPLEEVARRARAALGTALGDYRATTQDTLQGLPEGGNVTLVPDVPGIEFNPPARSFRWQECIHEEAFSLRARGAAPGSQLRGTLSAYLGAILIADVRMTFQIADGAAHEPEQTLERTTAYRKIFASYSREDTEVVRQFELFAQTYGDRYLIDVRDIRAGEAWAARVEELIRDADVFQLFWSRRSMHSEYVRREWEYALSLQRAAFVRPVFWEKPMPRDDTAGLPPAELDRLGFATFGQLAPATPAASSEPPPPPISSPGPATGRSEAYVRKGQRRPTASWLGGLPVAVCLLLAIGAGSFVWNDRQRRADDAAALVQRQHELDRLRQELEATQARALELEAAVASARDEDVRQKLRAELERAKARADAAARGLERGAIVRGAGGSTKPSGTGSGAGQCPPGDPLCAD